MTKAVLEQVTSALLSAHSKKIREVSREYASKRYFFATGKSVELENLKRKIEVSTSNDLTLGDLEQMYYSIRMAESVHGGILDAIVDSFVQAREECNTTEDKEELPYWFKVVIFIRCLTEYRLIPAEPDVKK